MLTDEQIAKLYLLDYIVASFTSENSEYNGFYAGKIVNGYVQWLEHNEVDHRAVIFPTAFVAFETVVSHPLRFQFNTKSDYSLKMVSRIFHQWWPANVVPRYE